LLVSLLVSFLVAAISLPIWIRKAKKIGLVWEDMNKWGHPKNVASSGGIVIILSFILGVLYYVAVKTFLVENNPQVILSIFALISVILIFAGLGLVDDLFGWKDGGLPRNLRIALAFVASIPLVVINAGNSAVTLPFFGAVNIGILYPLLIIPVAIAFSAISFNFLAGFNGLEAGQGILILTFFSAVAYFTGTQWLALVGMTMVAALLVFFAYNRFPAKVFPGDSLTWSIGALAAGMAILGNFEKVAMIVFIPYLIEIVLKARGRLEAHSFGKPNSDGSLNMPYKRIYGLTHFSILVLSKIKKKVYERDVVLFIFLIELFFIALASLTLLG